MFWFAEYYYLAYDLRHLVHRNNCNIKIGVNKKHQQEIVWISAWCDKYKLCLLLFSCTLEEEFLVAVYTGACCEACVEASRFHTAGYNSHTSMELYIYYIGVQYSAMVSTRPMAEQRSVSTVASQVVQHSFSRIQFNVCIFAAVFSGCFKGYYYVEWG